MLIVGVKDFAFVALFVILFAKIINIIEFLALFHVFVLYLHKICVLPVGH